jgi:hypothetical protein
VVVIEGTLDRNGHIDLMSSHLPTSCAKMAAALQEEWGRIPLDVVRNLVSDVPSRTRAVIDAKGGPTRY